MKYSKELLENIEKARGHLANAYMDIENEEQAKLIRASVRSAFVLLEDIREELRNIP